MFQSNCIQKKCTSHETFCYAFLIQVHFVYHSYPTQISKGTWKDTDAWQSMRDHSRLHLWGAVWPGTLVFSMATPIQSLKWIRICESCVVFNSQPIGASDYLEMSAVFDTVFIRNIPLLTLNKKTQARRFITLIDALYEHKVSRETLVIFVGRSWRNLWRFGGISPQVRVVLLAEAPLDELFVCEHHEDHDHHDTHVLLDDLGISRVIYKSFSI